MDADEGKCGGVMMMGVVIDKEPEHVKMVGARVGWLGWHGSQVKSG